MDGAILQASRNADAQETRIQTPKRSDMGCTIL